MELGAKYLREWRKTRYEAVLKVEYIGKPVLKQCIDEMSDEDLDFFLAHDNLWPQ